MFSRISRTDRRNIWSLPELVLKTVLDAQETDGHGNVNLNAPADILETASEYRLMVEAAGLTKDSTSVTLEGNTLTISGEKKDPWETQTESTWHANERRFGRFSRSFTVPSRVDSNKISARYQDGILEITLPKVPEAQPQKITIQTA